MKLPAFPDKFDAIQRRVLQGFALDLMGPHGLPHWSRVYRNGILIARSDPFVNLEVVTLFAMLHDSQRDNEYDDPEHGIRGSRYAQTLADEGLIQLPGQQLAILKAAIADHPMGWVMDMGTPAKDHHTIQACWDADRLDLGRVGTKPDIAYMATTYATSPGVVDRHWDEAFNATGMEAMIGVE